MTSEDSDILSALRSRGLTTADILRLIQAASEAKTGSSGLWETAFPYLVSAAAGVAMYMLTEEMEVPAEEERSEPLLDEEGMVEEEEEMDQRTERSVKSTGREKNQTNEILKALADLKQEVCSLSSYVKELVAPPIIKDFDIFSQPRSDTAPSTTLPPTSIPFNVFVDNLNRALEEIYQQNCPNRNVLITGSAALSMYISKLKSVPLQARYRKLHRNNSAFQNSVGKLQGYEQLLTSIGFVPRDNGGSFEWIWSLSYDASLSIDATSPPPPSYEEAKFLIEACVNALQTLSRGELPSKIEASEFQSSGSPGEINDEEKSSESKGQEPIVQKVPSFNEILQRSTEKASPEGQIQSMAGDAST